jgi:hypothetical protein
MKKITLLLLCFICSSLAFAQEHSDEKVVEEGVAATQDQENKPVKNTAINVGLMMGGGSLIGADLEFVIPNTSFGFQFGAGISSFGAGINYHLKKCANSPFVSIQYYHQGFGDNYYASWLGPMFIWRHKKLWQAGIGVGSLLEKGPQWTKLSEDQQKTSASLLFNLGLFF